MGEPQDRLGPRMVSDSRSHLNFTFTTALGDRERRMGRDGGSGIRKHRQSAITPPTLVEPLSWRGETAA